MSTRTVISHGGKRHSNLSLSLSMISVNLGEGFSNSPYLGSDRSDPITDLPTLPPHKKDAVLLTMRNQRQVSPEVNGGASRMTHQDI